MMAIALFPLNDGETIGSNIARYAEYMGMASTKYLRQRLFGYGCKVSTRLPCGISRLALQVRDYWNMDANQIIEKATEFNYRTMMASPGSRSNVFEMMRNAPDTTTLPKYPAFAGGYDLRPRYCVECLHEWRREGIAPYWKLSHQLPGVYYCDVHLCPLRLAGESPMVAMVDATVRRLMDKRDSTAIQGATVAQADSMRKVAVKSAQQLKAGTTKEVAHYLRLVRDAGLLRSNGRFKRDALVSSWLNLFGPTYCHLTGLSEGKMIFWWSLISGAAKADLPNPFLFISAEVLMEFLISSSGSLYPGSVESSVEILLGEMPKCSGSLHRDCDSYGGVRRLRKSRLWAVECTCGIAYKVFPDPAAFGARVKPFAYRERYKKHFFLLLDSGLNVESIAQEIRISRQIAMSWRKSKDASELSDMEKNERLPRRERDVLRREWRRLVHIAPPQRRLTAALRAGVAVYRRLALYDHEWLLTFNRRWRSPRNFDTLCSKNTLTEERMQKIRHAYNELVDSEPPLRLTRAAILRKAGLRISHGGNKYVVDLLSQLVESRSAYFARTCSWLLELPSSRRPKNKREFRELTGLYWFELTEEEKSAAQSCFFDS